MTGTAGADIAFARELAGRSGIDGRRAAGLLRRIDAIDRRLADPHLYLAVVGEFSGGKSTFINALLRDRLLATSAVPTTMVAADIRHGPRLQLQVRIAGVEGWASLPPTSREVERRLLTLLAGDPAPSDIRGWLRTVTTSPRLSGAVSSVLVEHPGELLRDGMVIIDTPGTNADEEQVELTRRIVAQRADVAVVVIASSAPVPDSLVRFLRDSFEPQVLQRCIFVVSKLHHVDVEDREPLLRVVRQRLERKLQLDGLTVLAMPTVPATEQLVRRRLFRLRRPRWMDELEPLEARLRAWMRQERSLIVSDRTLRLLDELLDELQRSLDDRRVLLDQQREALRAARPRDLEGFMEGLSIEAATALRREVGSLRDLLDRRLRDRKQECRRAEPLGQARPGRRRRGPRGRDRSGGRPHAGGGRRRCGG